MYITSVNLKLKGSAQPTDHVQKYALKIFAKVSLQFMTLKVLRAKLADILKCLTVREAFISGCVQLSFRWLCKNNVFLQNLFTRYLTIPVHDSLLIFTIQVCGVTSPKPPGAMEQVCTFTISVDIIVNVLCAEFHPIIFTGWISCRPCKTKMQLFFF